MPFRFKQFFAVIPNTHLLYKLRAYILSDSYISWLHYVTSGYVLSQSTVCIQHPLKGFQVFPKDLSFGSTYLFITVLCNSNKHSKFFLFADTIKIVHSISSATLPQRC